MHEASLNLRSKNACVVNDSEFRESPSKNDNRMISPLRKIRHANNARTPREVLADMIATIYDACKHCGNSQVRLQTCKTCFRFLADYPPDCIYRTCAQMKRCKRRDAHQSAKRREVGVGQLTSTPQILNLWRSRFDAGKLELALMRQSNGSTSTVQSTFST